MRCFVKGAPDQLLDRAAFALDSNLQRVPLAPIHDRYLAYNASLGKQGLRVMALARKDFDPASFDPDADLLPLISDLTLLALVGIVDPPRPEAKVAIEKARAAGIQVRMITGDHAVTAAAIAEQLGIPGRAITGAEFAALSEEQAQAQIGEIGVIARVAPEDKVRLVNVLKRAGNVVAMTGDGVNDAPALKTADIGVAMGITGTDVSKEAAVMILTDDNFATIIRAVENGRNLYENLMKYIRFQMGTLFAWILTFLVAAIFNILGGVPMQPLQVLLIKFSIVIFLAIGLGLGNPRPEVMQEKPRKAGEQIMPTPLAVSLGVSGLIRAASVLVAIVYALNSSSDTAVAHTMALVTFSMACIFFALECNDQTALGLQPGDARESPAHPHDRVVAAAAVCGGLHGLSAPPAGDGGPDAVALGGGDRAGIGRAVDERDREDLPPPRRRSRHCGYHCDHDACRACRGKRRVDASSKKCRGAPTAELARFPHCRADVALRSVASDHPILRFAMSATSSPSAPSSRRARLEQWAPGLRILRTYDRSWLPRDLVAGLILSALLIPQGMAYAELAGLPAITGLYTTVICLLAYAIFGPSPRLVLGPDSSLGPMIAAAILPLAAGSADKAIALAGALALLVGLICVVAAATRLGFVADLLSKPVRVGYLAGLAVTIIVGQLPKLLRLFRRR